MDQLAADLRPVRRLRSGAAIMLWVTVSWAFVVALTFATGDLRPGALEQLRESPRFAVECVLGFVTGLFVFRTGLLLALPGRVRWKDAVVFALGLIALWIGFYVYGLFDPALEPSKLGYRPHCFAEVLAYSSVPIALGLFLVARRTPLQRGWTGALVGASAAALPALIMQIACMYDPKHILITHLLPVVIMGVVGGLLGVILLRKA